MQVMQHIFSRSVSTRSTVLTGTGAAGTGTIQFAAGEWDQNIGAYRNLFESLKITQSWYKSFEAYANRRFVFDNVVGWFAGHFNFPSLPQGKRFQLLNLMWIFQLQSRLHSVAKREYLESCSGWNSGRRRLSFGSRPGSLETWFHFVVLE